MNNPGKTAEKKDKFYYYFVFGFFCFLFSQKAFTKSLGLLIGPF